MNNFRTAFAAALQALCIAAYAGIEEDIYVRVIRRHPDVRNLETVDTVAWYSDEAVRLDVEPVRAGRCLAIPDGSTAAWIVADELGTNWLVRYDLAPTSNACTFALAAGEGRLPPGRDYTGYVTILSGTNVLGVVDRHRVNVAWNPADPGAESVMPPSEYPPIVDAVQDYLDAAAGTVEAWETEATEQLDYVTDQLGLVQRAIEYETGTPGLLFRYEDDGSLWAESYEGRAAVGTLVVPAFHDGKKVRGVTADFDFGACAASCTNFVSWAPELKTVFTNDDDGARFVRPTWPTALLSVSLPLVREIPASLFVGTALKTVYAPNAVRIGPGAFSGTALSSIDFPALQVAGMGAFAGTPATNAVLPEIRELSGDMFGSELRSLRAPKAVRIRNGRGQGDDLITDVVVPSSAPVFAHITNIYLPACMDIGSRVFGAGSAVQRLHAPKLRRMGPENFLPNLVEIDCPECTEWEAKIAPPEHSGAHNFAGKYETNNVLRRVRLGVETLPDNAFRNCSALEMAELPNLLEGPRWGFAGCTNLLYVSVPAMLRSGAGMFRGCRRLGWAELTSCVDIAAETFKGCVRLAQAVGHRPIVNYGEESFDEYPDSEIHENAKEKGWQTRIVQRANFCAVWAPAAETVGKEAFAVANDKAVDISTRLYLRVVDLPKAKTIGASAFRNQRCLHTVNLPQAEVIGPAAFVHAGSYQSPRMDSQADFGPITDIDLRNVRRIEERAFAYACFARSSGNHRGNGESIYADGPRAPDGHWPGMRCLDLPSVTYIAEDAFSSTWKILSINAPSWRPEHTLDEYSTTFGWSFSITNISWMGAGFDSAVLWFTNCASLGTTNRVEFVDCSDVLLLLDGPDGQGSFSGCTLDLPDPRLPHTVRLTIMTCQIGNPATLHVTVEGSDWFAADLPDDANFELLYTPAFSSEEAGRWSYLSGRNQYDMSDVEVEFMGADGWRFLLQRL